MDKGSPSRRVLIVSASMGAGHQQVSEELRRQLTERGHYASIADFNELLPGPTGGWLAKFYPWLVNRAPGLYDAIYRTFFLAPQEHGERVRVTMLLATPALRRLVDQFRPDVVVSTFHIAGLAVARLRSQGVLGCPAVTFITTFAVHNLWVHQDADLHMCISRAAADDAARRSGRPSAVCGAVVRPMFARPPESATETQGGRATTTGRPDTRKELRHEIGMPTEGRMALIVAGSLGLGDVDRAARAIAGSPGWIPVISCGRNEDLRAHLAERGVGIILGWVDDMASLMDAADALVENAGGLSAKEALCRGLPVVTFRPISGHGRDDANSLARLGLTDIADDDETLRVVLKRLTAESTERAKRVARGKELLDGDPVAEIERVTGVRQDVFSRP